MLPIDVINIICEFAAGSDKKWYPQFSPKTHRIKWKVNKYCKYWLEKASCMYHEPSYSHSYTVEGEMCLINNKTMTTIERKHKTIIYQFARNEFQMYIQFDSENNPNLQNKHIYRTHVNMIGTHRGGYYKVGQHMDEIVGESILYLNNIMYGFICWVDFNVSRNNYLTIDCENY